MSDLLDTLVIKTKIPKSLTCYGFDHNTVWQTGDLACCCENYVLTKAGNLRQNVYRLSVEPTGSIGNGHIPVYSTMLDHTVPVKHSGSIFAWALKPDPEDTGNGKFVTTWDRRDLPSRFGVRVSARLIFRAGKLTRITKYMAVGVCYQRVP